MKKIGIFGGTFDPIHNAHVQLALTFREQMHMDEVWFLVTPQNPWKQGRSLSSDHHRLKMAQLAVADKEGLVASDYEFHLEKPTYTYLTLRHLRKDYPDVEFTLLVGGDNWASFDKWAEWQEIVEHHPIAVYPRDGHSVDTPAALHDISLSITTLKAALLPISSTSIRQRVAEHSRVDAMVHPDVEKYIKDNNLYSLSPSLSHREGVKI